MKNKMVYDMETGELKPFEVLEESELSCDSNW